MWVVAVAVIVLITLRASRGQPLKQGGTIIVLSLFVLAVVCRPLQRRIGFSQPAGTRGSDLSLRRPVIVNRLCGRVFTWSIPFAETVVRYPISRQTYTMSVAPSEGAVTGGRLNHRAHLRWSGNYCRFVGDLRD